MSDMEEGELSDAAPAEDIARPQVLPSPEVPSGIQHNVRRTAAQPAFRVTFATMNSDLPVSNRP
jgi:hypothetical protein